MRLEDILLEKARQLSLLGGTDFCIFDHEHRDFADGKMPSFCEQCLFRQEEDCRPSYTHTYGCYEAERWDGLYIYYCPSGLVFTATAIHAAGLPAFSLICGPIVMGSHADVLMPNNIRMSEEILRLPATPVGTVTAFSQLQKTVSAYLSSSVVEESESASKAQKELLNTLYDISLDIQSEVDYSYPLAIEKELQSRITGGDKEGAQELINQLLGHLYFQTKGDFSIVKGQAKALVVLFSRASIEGGADARQIFGLNDDMLKSIDSFQTLDELSAFLTSIFHRFVSYIFDFKEVKNVDIIYKTVNFIRQNYTKKITLDDVANHVYLSKSYLSKILKTELHCSFIQYVNTLRIEKSKTLLMNPAISLADIAALTGFSDQSYFSKIFHKTTGLSPQRYRQKRGNSG